MDEGQIRNIRDLPWFEEGDFERIKRLEQRAAPPFVLPDLADVLVVAENIFQKAKKLKHWEPNDEFFRQPDVGAFLREIMCSFQKLKDSASHTAVWCAWKDNHRNVCGAKVDIKVDPNGAFYECQVDPT